MPKDKLQNQNISGFGSLPSQQTILPLSITLQCEACGHTQNSTITFQNVCVIQGAAGGQHTAGGQRGVQGGAEVLEDTASGGARAGPGLQALPAQHPVPMHGAGVPHRGRGQSPCPLRPSWLLQLCWAAFFGCSSFYMHCLWPRIISQIVNRREDAVLCYWPLDKCSLIMYMKNCS